MAGCLPRPCHHCFDHHCFDDDGSESEEAFSESSTDDAEEEEDPELMEYTWDSLYFPQLAGGPATGSMRSVQSDGRVASLRSDTLGATLMQGTFLNYATNLPDPGLSPTEPPLVSMELPGLTMERVIEMWKAEPFILERLFTRDDGAIEMSRAAWQDGIRIPGTKIRGVSFQIPMPDIPPAVRKLMAAPDWAGIQVFCRKRTTAQQLDVVQQTVTEHIPMGDCFRVQKLFSFSPGNGGVTFKHWVDLVWVKSLPWALSYLKGFIESKAKDSGKLGARKIGELLLQEK